MGSASGTGLGLFWEAWFRIQVPPTYKVPLAEGTELQKFLPEAIQKILPIPATPNLPKPTRVCKSSIATVHEETFEFVGKEIPLNPRFGAGALWAVDRCQALELPALANSYP